MTASRLTGKRVISALVTVPALLLLLAATRTWLTGRSADPLLGGGAVTATGSQLAPGVIALALVALVGLVTALTGGRIVRRVSAVVVVLAALGAVGLTLGPVQDPQTALGRVAASGLGRTGAVRTTADPTPWLWLAILSAVVLTAAGVLAVVAVGRWGGLSRRFDAPVDPAGAPAAVERTVTDASRDQDGSATSAEPDRVPTARSAWDDLSEGRDPTLAGPRRPDGTRPAGHPPAAAGSDASTSQDAADPT